MKNKFIISVICATLLPVVLTTSAYVQDDTSGSATDSTEHPNTKSHEYLTGGDYATKPDTALQISEYVRRIFQDKDQNLWFATNSRGVCKYDGKTFAYYTTEEGLSGNQVRGIVEDTEGILWFATSGGLSSYDGESFTNHTDADGLSADGFWSIISDESSTIWVGGANRVSRFDGKTFTTVPIPQLNETDTLGGRTVVSSIIQDRSGNLWFATDGAGVFRYDGNSFSNLTENDGLNGNLVCCILEARDGDLWIGTRRNGVTRFDGDSFIDFATGEVMSQDLIWNIYEDRAANIWFTSLGVGVYRYDGKSLTLFNKKDGLANLAVQSVLEDKQGRLWFGTGAGLYRYDGKSFFNVTKNGPW